jgi:hypothetical protein
VDFPLGTLRALDEQLSRLRGSRAMEFVFERIRQNSQIVLRDAPAAIRSEAVDALIVDQDRPTQIGENGNQSWPRLPREGRAPTRPTFSRPKLRSFDDRSNFGCGCAALGSMQAIVLRKVIFLWNLFITEPCRRWTAIGNR